MMFIFRLVKNFDERYGDYPDGIIAIGWLSLVTCLICIPIGAVINWNVCLVACCAGTLVVVEVSFSFPHASPHTGTRGRDPRSPPGRRRAVLLAAGPCGRHAERRHLRGPREEGCMCPALSSPPPSPRTHVISRAQVEQPMQPHIQMFFQDDAQRAADAEPAPPVPTFPHPLTQTSTNALGQPYTVADASPVKTCPLAALSQRSTSASVTAAGPVL